MEKKETKYNYYLAVGFAICVFGKHHDIKNDYLDTILTIIGISLVMYGGYIFIKENRSKEN